MKSDLSPREESRLHRWLWEVGYVRERLNEDYSNSRDQFDNVFIEARHLIRQKDFLKKDEQTGLLYYAGSLRYTAWNNNWPNYTRGFFQAFWPPGRFLEQQLTRDANASLIDDKCVLSVGSGGGLAEISLVKKRQPKV